GVWTRSVGAVVTSIMLGVIGLGFIWWVVRGETSGVPNRRQAFVELLIEFVDDQAKGIFYHGDRSKFIAAAALTVFVWVVLMNTMDLLPIDIITIVLGWFHLHEWRPVPTADVNTTFALSLSGFVRRLYFPIV